MLFFASSNPILLWLLVAFVHKPARCCLGSLYEKFCSWSTSYVIQILFSKKGALAGPTACTANAARGAKQKVKQKNELQNFVSVTKFGQSSSLN